MGIFRKVVCRLNIICRKSAAHVDHAQSDVFFFLKGIEKILCLCDGVVPYTDVTLLAAYVETDSVWCKAKIFCHDDEVIGHVRMTAKFAAQRPVCRGGSIDEDAHIDAAARSILCNVLEIFLAVRGKHAHALLVKIFDVLRLLDRVAVRKTVRTYIELENPIKFIAACDVKAASHFRKHLKHRIPRICLDGIVDSRIRERILEADEVLFDCVEVYNDIWSFKVFGK